MAEENNNASNQAPMSGGNSGGSDTPTNPFAGGGIPDFGGGSTSPTGGGASTQGSGSMGGGSMGGGSMGSASQGSPAFAASGSPIEGSSGSQGGGSMGSGSASGEGEYEWDIEGSESQGNGSMGGGPQGGNPFGGGGSMGGGSMGGGSMGGSVGDGGEEPAIVGTNITLNVSGDGEVEGEQLSMGEDGSVPYLGNNISPLSDDGNSENYEYDLTGAEQSASSGGGEEMTM
ncbi:MAG: hypothetical protein BRC48_02085 [Cyanobacteria bacterium QS_9_48_30]|nr:MAG: hypothetical protein BRC48_02085 [Cyanobacteria bacterium QS_9_48_30]